MRVRAGCVRRRAEVVAHQLSHTPQVDSIFNVPAGKDSLPWNVAGQREDICKAKPPSEPIRPIAPDKQIRTRKERENGPLCYSNRRRLLTVTGVAGIGYALSWIAGLAVVSIALARAARRSGAPAAAKGRRHRRRCGRPG